MTPAQRKEGADLWNGLIPPERQLGGPFWRNGATSPADAVTHQLTMTGLSAHLSPRNHPFLSRLRGVIGWRTLSPRGSSCATACGDEAAPHAHGLSGAPRTGSPSSARRSSYAGPNPSFFPYVRYSRPSGSVRCALHPTRSEANHPYPRRGRRADPPGRMHKHASGRRVQRQLRRPWR